MEIVESGVKFGPFEEIDIFQIEKFTNFVPDAKAVEFIWIRDHISSMIFVEAKSSFSKPESTDDFAMNLKDIYQKFTDSLLILLSTHCNRNQNVAECLPEKFININWSSMNIHFRLVIPNFKSEWLQPISDALRMQCRHILGAFKINKLNISILNKEMAIKQGLIIEDENV